MRTQSRIIIRSAFRIKVVCRKTNLLLGYAGDLSAGGIKLLSDEAFEQGAELDVTLRFRNSKGDLDSINLDLRCQWCTPNKRTGNVESGFSLRSPVAELALLARRMGAGLTAGN